MKVTSSQFQPDVAETPQLLLYNLVTTDNASQA